MTRAVCACGEVRDDFGACWRCDAPGAPRARALLRRLARARRRHFVRSTTMREACERGTWWTVEETTGKRRRAETMHARTRAAAVAEWWMRHARGARADCHAADALTLYREAASSRIGARLLVEVEESPAVPREVPGMLEAALVLAWWRFRYPPRRLARLEGVV